MTDIKYAQIKDHYNSSFCPLSLSSSAPTIEPQALTAMASAFTATAPTVTDTPKKPLMLLPSVSHCCRHHHCHPRALGTQDSTSLRSGDARSDWPRPLGGSIRCWMCCPHPRATPPPPLTSPLPPSVGDRLSTLKLVATFAAAPEP
jgi:hypothetical protein